MVDPIHQFQITKLFTIAKIGSVEIVLTNSAIYMIVAVTVICAFLIVSTRSRALVPGRLQAVAEMLTNLWPTCSVAPRAQKECNSSPWCSRSSALS